MNDDPTALSRRALLKGGTYLAAATATAAMAGLGAGCATFPEVGEVHGVHPCSHLHCRYWASDTADGHCVLPLRQQGGRP